MKENTKKKLLKKIKTRSLYVLFLFAFVIFLIFILNQYIINITKDRILRIEDSENIEKADAIIVLGAAVHGKKPSPILKERLDTAIKAFNENLAPVIIMTGDGGGQYYNEVAVMKEYAIGQGIPSDKIFIDHEGFSTYESIYRAKKVFDLNSALIVSQRYHLYRALYIASKFDLQSRGLDAKVNNFSGDNYREMREKMARIKDIVYCLIKPVPANSDKKIDLNLSGDLTNKK